MKQGKWQCEYFRLRITNTELRERLNTQAKRHGISISDIMNEGIKREVKRLELTKTVLSEKE